MLPIGIGTSMEIIFHYPPELLSLLIETLPRLCKTKRDLLVFFQGAGVNRNMLSPYDELLRTNRDAFKKHIVTRELLTKLNELGERSLRERRELLKRLPSFRISQSVGKRTKQLHEVWSLKSGN
jgi:restriction system protein